ncbi:MAG: energy transducer TonB [Burkholderiaceae bacterium]|nr:energy transducer TonB [Burkholderiaceae bacterium]
MHTAPLPSHSPDALPPAARRALLLGAAAAHVGLVWALLQLEPVRSAIGAVAPIMVDWIAPPAPAPLPPPPPPPPKARVKPQPKPVIVSEPAPTPVTPVFVAPPAPPPQPPPEPVPPAPAPEPVAVVAAAPPPPPAPRTIAITAVEYLTPPVLNYPLASRRAQEQGQVHVRVLVDARGVPQQMSVIRSSGFARLDESALATVRATRFKPYTENGTPLPFWVVMPLVFELQ